MKRGNTHHSEKVGHSLFSFLDTLNKETSYCRKYVNFILVYNEEKISIRIINCLKMVISCRNKDKN